MKVRTSVDRHEAFYVIDTSRGGHFSLGCFFCWVGGEEEGLWLMGELLRHESFGRDDTYMAHSTLKQMITMENTGERLVFMSSTPKMP